jgi:hypothetical protein
MRRRLATVMLALACAVTAFLGFSETASHPATKPKAPEQGPSQAGCGPTCGEERWAVKTLSDPDASTVDFTPVSQTLAGLVALPAPTGSSETSRLNPTERTTFKVHARLVGYKIEFEPRTNKGDHDFHIVIADIQDPTKTMVVEIPDPVCGGVCASVKLNDIKSVRSDFPTHFPSAPPTSEFKTVQGNVEVDVTGVGFFDFAHGQTGLAPNCIELHPVLSLQFSSPGPFKAGHNPQATPRTRPRSFYHCIPEAHSGPGGSH